MSQEYSEGYDDAAKLLKPLAEFGRWCLDSIQRGDDIEHTEVASKAADLGLLEFYQAFVGSPADADVEWRVSETDAAKVLTTWSHLLP